MYITRYRQTRHRFSLWLERQNIFIFIAIMYSITLLITLIISIPVELGFITDIEFYPPPSLDGKTIFNFIFPILFIAPILETALNQSLPFWLMWRFKSCRESSWIIILVSGFIFGILHFYSVMYMIQTFIIGMIFMWGYIIRRERRPFWSITLFHFIWNLPLVLYDIVVR